MKEKLYSIEDINELINNIKEDIISIVNKDNVDTAVKDERISDMVKSELGRISRRKAITSWDINWEDLIHVILKNHLDGKMTDFGNCIGAKSTQFGDLFIFSDATIYVEEEPDRPGAVAYTIPNTKPIFLIRYCATNSSVKIPGIICNINVYDIYGNIIKELRDIKGKEKIIGTFNDRIDDGNDELRGTYMGINSVLNTIISYLRNESGIIMKEEK